MPQLGIRLMGLVSQFGVGLKAGSAGHDGA